MGNETGSGGSGDDAAKMSKNLEDDQTGLDKTQKVLMRLGEMEDKFRDIAKSQMKRVEGDGTSQTLLGGTDHEDQDSADTTATAAGTHHKEAS